MEKYNCPRGVVAVQDEEGNYVPFLISVRGEDIIWNKELPEELKDIFTEEPSARYIKEPTLKLVSKTWNDNDQFGEKMYATITKDLDVEFTKRIHVTVDHFVRENYAYINSNTTSKSIYTTLHLPINVSAAILDNFSVSAVLLSEYSEEGTTSGHEINNASVYFDDPITYSNVRVHLPKKYVTYEGQTYAYYDEVKIELVNKDGITNIPGVNNGTYTVAFKLTGTVFQQGEKRDVWSK